MRDSVTQDFRIPVRWVEDCARATPGRTRNIAPILRATGSDSVYLVTHAWHHAAWPDGFRQSGIAVTVAPVFMDRLPTPIFSGLLLPGPSVWQVTYYAVHEWLGCLFEHAVGCKGTPRWNHCRP